MKLTSKKYKGDNGDLFYLILRGKVKIETTVKRIETKIVNKKYINTEISEKRYIKDLVAGDTFGEIALIDSKSRSATIICLKDCDFIAFDK